MVEMKSPTLSRDCSLSSMIMSAIVLDVLHRIKNAKGDTDQIDAARGQSNIACTADSKMESHKSQVASKPGTRCARATREGKADKLLSTQTHAF